MVETRLSLKTDWNALEFMDSPTEIESEYKSPIKQ
jgi:hypothetical protein